MRGKKINLTIIQTIILIVSGNSNLLKISRQILAFMESFEKKQTIIHGFGGNSKQDYIVDMQNALTK